MVLFRLTTTMSNHPGVDRIWCVKKSHSREYFFENSMFYLLQDDYVYIY